MLKPSRRKTLEVIDILVSVFEKPVEARLRFGVALKPYKKS